MTPRHRNLIRWMQPGICTGILFAIGCQGTSVRQSDELEARLRDQQATIERLTASLEDAKSERNVAKREASILRDELTKSQPSTEIIQASHSLSRVDRIEVVPLLSGGLDRDGVPGDELVSILVAPKDANGEIHRVQGTIAIRLIDISLPADEQEISSETFSESKTDALWHNGIVGRGFRMIVPLPAGLNRDEITAHVRLTTTDERQLDTLHQISVSPQSGADQRPLSE